MARQSIFSDAEDRIILRHANQPASEVNAALASAGFPERTAQQLSQRRYYLRRRRPVAKVAHSGSNVIIALEAERHDILREITAIDKKRTKLETQLRHVTDALLHQMGLLEADVAKVRALTPTVPVTPERLGGGRRLRRR